MKQQCQQSVWSFFTDFWKYRDLMTLLVQKNIKVKYRRSILGYLWSVLNPLLVMLVMVLVFSTMFRRDIENYPVYLLTGQILFTFMSGATQGATTSMLESVTLMRKARVPKQIFVISKLTGFAVDMLFSMAALILVIIFTGASFHLTMLYSPVVFLQIYVFVVGMSLFLAQACVFFQDIGFIYRAFVTAWQYLTPIFYPIEILPAPVAAVIRYGNPMFQYVNQFRSVVYLGQMPVLSDVLIGSAFALGMLFLGVSTFRKSEHKFVLYI